MGFALWTINSDCHTLSSATALCSCSDQASGQGELGATVDLVKVDGRPGSKAGKAFCLRTQIRQICIDFPSQTVPLSWLCSWAKLLAGTTPWVLQMGTWSDKIQELVLQASPAFSVMIRFPVVKSHSSSVSLLRQDQSGGSQRWPTILGSWIPLWDLFSYLRDHRL